MAIPVAECFRFGHVHPAIRTLNHFPRPGPQLFFGARGGKQPLDRQHDNDDGDQD